MLSLFTAFNVILYFSHAYLWLWQEARISPFKPLHWYLFTISVGFVFILIRAWGRFRLPSGPSLWLMIWGITFVVMTSLSFLFLSSQDEIPLQALIKNSEATALLLIFILLLQDKKVVRIATYSLLFAVIGGVILNYIDFFMHGRLNMSFVDGRAAGIYVNPNTSGMMMVFGMVLTVFILPKRLRFIYCLFVASGVFLTFSRGAIVLWVVAMFCLAWKDAFVLSRLPSLIGMGVLVALLATSLVAGDWLVAFKSSGMKKYLTSNTENRIGSSFMAQDDYSARSRMLVARRGLQMFLDKPFLGNGVGSTQQLATRVSTHNMYLLMGAEQGIIGVAILLALILILWRAGTNIGRICAILYAISGMFTHNSFEQPSMQVVLALAVVGMGVMREKKSASSRAVSGHPRSAPA